MTQNPYAQFGNPAIGGPAGGGAGFDQYPAPMRTSVLAIMALVFSLLCFIPGAGALAIVFGGAAILFISGSKGRLGGLGLAISGILIGLVTTVIWLFIGMGAMAAIKGFDSALIQPTSTMVTALEAKDYATARQYMDPVLDKAVTDQQLGEFVAAYQAQVGSFQKMPKSIGEYISAFGVVGQKMQGFQGNRQGEIPIPTTFDQGMGVMIIRIPQGGSAQPQPGGVLPKITNLGVITGATTTIWLLDPYTLKPVDNSAAAASGGGSGEESGSADEGSGTEQPGGEGG